jgi:hypothetical protein
MVGVGLARLGVGDGEVDWVGAVEGVGDTAGEGEGEGEGEGDGDGEVAGRQLVLPVSLKVLPATGTNRHV